MLFLHFWIDRNNDLLAVHQFEKIIQDEILNNWGFFWISLDSLGILGILGIIGILGILKILEILKIIRLFSHQSSWFLQIEQVELVQFDLLESFHCHHSCHHRFKEGWVQLQIVNLMFTVGTIYKANWWISSMSEFDRVWQNSKTRHARFSYFLKPEPKKNPMF